MRVFQAIVLGLTLGLTPALALADIKPSAADAKRVLDYYYNGKGMGPILLETKICREIYREGDQKYECSGDITTETLKKEDSVYLWMAYMSPTGEDPQNVIVQFENGGVTRMVKNLKISGQLRNRAWLKVNLDKIGQWKIKIVHDTGSDAVPLGARDVTVE